MTIISGKFTISTNNTTKIVDYYKKKLCIEIDNDCKKVLLKAEQQGSYIVTINLRILQNYISKSNDISTYLKIADKPLSENYKQIRTSSNRLIQSNKAVFHRLNENDHVKFLLI